MRKTLVIAACGVILAAGVVQGTDVPASRRGEFKVADTSQKVPPGCPEARNVFFTPGSAEISADGKNIVREYRAKQARCNPNKILIVGHAGREHTENDSIRLSTERAEAVRDFLVEIGWPKPRTEVIAKGESEPATPTEDGVVEQRNDRVVLDVQF